MNRTYSISLHHGGIICNMVEELLTSDLTKKKRVALQNRIMTGLRVMGLIEHKPATFRIGLAIDSAGFKSIEIVDTTPITDVEKNSTSSTSTSIST